MELSNGLCRILNRKVLNFKTLFILKILKDLNQKVIVTFQGVDIQINKSINYGYRLNKSYEKRLLSTLNNIDKFISISENIKKDLLDLGVNKDKIIMIPNGVEKKKFLQPEEIVEGIEKKVYLVTVGRFAKEKKGFDLFPKIAKLLIERKINFQWTIVGHNSKNIKTIKNMEDFEDNFIYLDNIENLEEKFFPHNDLIKVYKKNHIYANLARIESFGITIIEALASSLPVITFDTKGGNELIKNDYNGIIVKELSSELMVNAIYSYINNIDLYAKHKTNAVTSIEDFDLSLITQKTIKCYKEVLN